MKRIIYSLVLLSFAVSTAYASCDNANLTVSEGQEKSIDVIGGNPTTIAFLSKSNSLVAEVAQEFAGFECQVNKVERKDGCQLVEVTWSPGADVSGCMLKLGTGKAQASVYLYMNY